MSDGRQRHLLLTTPEGVTFRMPLAGPVSRLLALIVDFLVVNVALSILVSGVQLVGVVSQDFSFGLYALLAFLLPMLYSMVLESVWRGQTIGKRLLNLKVVDQDGLRLQVSQVVVRNLLRAVDSLPVFYLVGGVSCLVTQRAQRLGDLAANTVVIRTASSYRPDLSVLATDKYNSFRDDPLIVSRLRQKLGNEEISLILRALTRRARLEPLARVALYRELAEYVKSRVSFSDESLLGQSDEQFLRNVADILFHRKSKSTQVL
jgi:uncharacterized RDD family membrane protein YckC